ncbi:MAG: hypothetical protein ACYS99_12060 [Planctomycetota bacterium]
MITVLILASGVLLLLAGALPHLFVLGHLGVRLAPGEEARTAQWCTLITALLAIGSLGSLATGVRLRVEGTVPIAVALMGLAGLKLFFFDAMRVPPSHLVCSASVFGVALILCSFLYRRHRGLPPPRAVQGDMS